ncbi:MAG: hypothetical protein ACM31C_19255 [Acidobacteriota bacterium]
MHRLVLLLCVFAACRTSLDDPPPSALLPDATSIPSSPAGIFRVTSTFDVASAPLSAQPILAALADATDDPDDPGRFLVDRMIAAMPVGTAQTIAYALEPLLVASVQADLAEVAPHLAPGIAALSHGLEHFARHFSTLELWRIESSGVTTRVVSGFGFDGIDVTFDAANLPDEVTTTKVSLAGSELAITDHELALPYGQLLRLALDRAVVPSVVPGTTDVAQALRALVDCRALGATVAKSLGATTGTLYAVACDAAMVEAADAFYDKLAAIDEAPLSLALSGSATAVDRDGDGTMDALAAGEWSGGFDLGGTRTPFGVATFQGAK